MDKTALKKKLHAALENKLELQVRETTPAFGDEDEPFTGSWRVGDQTGNAVWLLDRLRDGDVVEFSGYAGRVVEASDEGDWVTEFKFNAMPDKRWRYS
jgi:hypothetical protein